MSTNSSLDSESFQQLLASAFAVQESRMDTQSLSAVIEIQRLIAAGNLDVDVAVQLIADRARRVANAAGVAIGLLQGRQLVYRAGIGSAAPYAGRHLTATLSVSANTKASREILRVENAQTDARIEAAICRQFGAESLLIMPIYQGEVVSGVLEVMFSEAHAFQDREVRAYRLMAGLLGEALQRAAQAEEKRVPALELEIMRPAIEQSASQMQELPVQELPADQGFVPEAENRHAIYQICQAALAVAGRLPAFWRLPGVGTMIQQRVGRLPLNISQLNIPQLSAVAAAVVAIVIVGWSAHGSRRVTAPETPELQTTNSVEQQAESASARLIPVNASHLQSSAPIAAPAKKTSESGFRRVRVGGNEIDYVTDDVTIRYFAPSPALQPLRAYNQVEFGNDVTVRYFPSAPVVSATHPVNRTLPEREKLIPSKLAR